MKRLLASLIGVLCIANAYSATVKPTGYTVQCKTKMDTIGKNSAYALTSPKVNLENEMLNVSVVYYVFNCVETNGKIGFAVTTETKKGDRLSLQNPRLFTVDTYAAPLLSNGAGEVAFQFSVKSALTKKELKDYMNGEVVKKEMYIYYENNLLDNNYRKSGGYYVLNFEVQNGDANITGFSAN
ncbi:MAG: hypothetical protein WC635_06280 [Bacteriovorax sp.]